jgi:hypothetical protein
MMIGSEARPAGMPAHAGSRRSWLVFCTVMLGFGLLAVAFGQGNSWDLHNYHLYNGWAFWTGRGDRDFAAAQLQSYFNPLLATASYLLFVHTPPWLSTFMLGALQGANFIPVYLLARRLLPSPAGNNRRLAGAVALVGVCGATQLSELGSSMGDNLVSLATLGALALVLCHEELSLRRALIAAVLVGLTAGIKLTSVPFAIGVFASTLLLAGPRHRVRLLMAMAVAAAAGFLAVDGFWMLHLYRDFGNPLFPMFGDWFGGPFAAPMDMRDTRFVPGTFVEWVFYPLVWLVTSHRVSDSFFFDLRIPLAFLAAPLLLWPAVGIDRRTERALLAGLAIAYLVWLAFFSIYRYALPLEMLSPLLIALALARVPQPGAAIALPVLLALMAICVRAPGWGRLHYGDKYFEATIPELPRMDEATILFPEDEPLAFLALGFPPSTQFVRIGGNILGWPYPPYGMDREAARRIASAHGPLYALLLDPDSERVKAVLARQLLALDRPCTQISSNMRVGSPQLCPVRRLPSP